MKDFQKWRDHTLKWTKKITAKQMSSGLHFTILSQEGFLFRRLLGILGTILSKLLILLLREEHHTLALNHLEWKLKTIKMWSKNLDSLLS